MFVKLADVNSGTAAFLRCALALTVLVPLAACELRRRGRFDPELVWCALAAGVFLGLDFVMWTVGVLDVGAAIAAVLINVQVVVFPLLARIFGRTPLSRRFLIASPVMIAGVALASGVIGHSRQVTHAFWGSLLGIAAGFGYAAYLYLNRLSGQRRPGHVITPVCIATTAAAVTAGAIGTVTTGIDLFLTVSAWGWMIALAMLGQVVSWLLISAGTPKLAPNVSATLLLLQPVIAIASGLIVLRETPTASQLLGCAIVIATVWGANRAPEFRRR
jgi:drug/metabolite transporter (DMT)-like permease